MLQRVMPERMGLGSLLVLNDEARKLGLARVIHLSATPFFLRGSGDEEGTLFPWTMSDFSLMEAIECGIVKLPRVPVAENIPLLGAGRQQPRHPRPLGLRRADGDRQIDADFKARVARAFRTIIVEAGRVSPVIST